MSNDQKIIYADNASTTFVSRPVLDAMLPFYTTCCGNPSSLHAIGRRAKRPLEEARDRVARCLGASPSEIFFTGCGTEADNWAVRGTAYAMAAEGKRHIITSKFEHHAILKTCEALEKEGFTVTYLDVHEDGLVVPAEVEAAITPETALVTIMCANNEIGTVQPIAEIGEICKKHGVLFHTDAVQAVGNVPIDVKKQNIDMLSISGHKFHGPKGVGALYLRRGLRIPNLINGGSQERGRRAGTENVAEIVGMSVALEIACNTMPERTARIAAMRDRLIDGLLQVECSRVNGDRAHRLPGNISMCFEGVDGEAMVLMLDLKGICASSGSACTSGSVDPSHVLLAIGLPKDIAQSSIRLSLSDENTDEEIDTILEVFPQIIHRLREMSPEWNARHHA